MELINFVYPNRIDMALDSIAAIPVFFVVYAYVQKKPTSTNFVSKVWLNGRSILIFSAVIKSALILALYMVVAEKLATSHWLHMVISIIIILYVYFSQRVKDTFMDFPEMHSED